MGNSRLSQLPAPAAIEETDFEGIFARKKAALTALCPESIRETVAQTLELESEPLTIDLQASLSRAARPQPHQRSRQSQPLGIRTRQRPRPHRRPIRTFTQNHPRRRPRREPAGCRRIRNRRRIPRPRPSPSRKIRRRAAHRIRSPRHRRTPPNHTRPRRAPRRRHGGGLHQNPKRHARRNHFDRRARIPARRNTPPPLRQRASNRRPTQRRGSRVFRRIPPRRQYSSRTADRLRSLG